MDGGIFNPVGTVHIYIRDGGVFDDLTHSHTADSVRQGAAWPEGTCWTPIKAHSEVSGQVGTFSKCRGLRQEIQRKVTQSLAVYTKVYLWSLVTEKLTI